jgi:dihydroorotase
VEALGGATADPHRVFDVLSRRPAAIARLRSVDARIGGQAAQGGALEPGEDANLCVVDPTKEVVVDPATLQSRARNTPYAGRRLQGAVRHTLVRGQAVVIDGGLTR